jgi:hypothetical protein
MGAGSDHVDDSRAPLTVDVIVDNYNYARFLRAAIDSALAQTYRHVRVTVVDDGSTDESRQIIEKYSDRVSAVYKENGGQASAFNASLEHSEGDIIVFLDSDDVLLPDAVARIVDVFRADPSVQRVHGRMEVIDVEGRRVGKMKPDAHLPMPHGDIRFETLRFPFDLAWLPTSANAFAAPMLRRILPMPEADYRSGADSYLVHLSSLFGPVGAVDEVTALYRVHGGNAYEQSSTAIDLRHVRESIRLADVTGVHLIECARALNLDPDPGRLLSFSDVANRAVSLRFDRDQHPIAGDSLNGLLRKGRRAAGQRTDVSWAMRLLFVSWLTAFTCSPRLVSWHLATIFLFPQRRARFNRVLGILHRAGPSTGSTQSQDAQGVSP